MAGTSIIAVPTDIAIRLNQLMGAQLAQGGVYTVDCSTISGFPLLSLSLGGKPYTLAGRDYIFRTATGACISPFVPSGINRPEGSVWVLGMSYDIGLCGKIPDQSWDLQVMSSSASISLFTTLATTLWVLRNRVLMHLSRYRKKLLVSKTPFAFSCI